MSLTPSSAGKVFVVEDDADIRVSVHEVLESEGYRVVSAGDGREALELLRAMEEKPQLILLDLRLPGKDGFQFRREQTQDLCLENIPVVILSADRTIDELQLELPANDLLRKPVDIEELLSAVKRHVG